MVIFPVLIFFPNALSALWYIPLPGFYVLEALMKIFHFSNTFYTLFYKIGKKSVKKSNRFMQPSNMLQFFNQLSRSHFLFLIILFFLVFSHKLDDFDFVHLYLIKCYCHYILRRLFSNLTLQLYLGISSNKRYLTERYLNASLFNMIYSF